jgi:3-carboxy-cis,cis-muconate cycloisomerase
MTLRLVESLVSTEPLAAEFSDNAILAALLKFEVALARVEAGLGVIPNAAADAIAGAAVLNDFDAPTIARAARESGTIVIAFVETLRKRVARSNASAATYVHWGATSQDASDTALVLCLKHAFPGVIADHDRVVRTLRALSDQHAGTVMLARTLLQSAPPTTFGLKAAGWFGSTSRAGAHMARALEDACVLQFGGASGTLAAIGSNGVAVAAALAQELGLKNPGAPWHAHRDRLASFVAACGVYTGTLAKIARDIALLMQDEVAEAAERGGSSSTMPHKRNPAGCAVALAAAARVPGLVATFLSTMPQEHERGVGGWHAEASTVAAVVQATASAALAIAGVLEGLTVDAERMRANIAATNGVVFAERAMTLLASALGRDKASALIASALDAARRERRGFVDVLAANADVNAALPADVLATLADPTAYLGAAEQFRRHLMDDSPK